MALRTQWEIPEGEKMIGEYWLPTNDPRVISIFEADSFEAIMHIEGVWDDSFDKKIFTAITAEEGLDWIKKKWGS